MPFRERDLDRFVQRGFLHLERAFAPELAERCRARLWEDLDEEPDDPSGWTRPAARILGPMEAAFREAVNGPRLHAALDQLLGSGRWRPRPAPGLMPIRFPSELDPGDAGWHVDGSFGPAPDYRLNLASRGRALLVLFLFSEVGEQDAPTRLAVGSHLVVPPILAPAGRDGLLYAEVTARIADLASFTVERATGEAGDAYLCHPFLIHAATWPHRGAGPRFMSQSPISGRGALRADRPGAHASPVEAAIRLGLEGAGIEPASAYPWDLEERET